MIKFFAMLLSSIVLIQSVHFDVNDIAKIPNLLDHVVYHIGYGENISDFMNQHYGSLRDVHKEKHDSHKNLPFKHQHVESHFQMVYIVSEVIVEFNIKEDQIQSNNFTYCEPISNLFSHSFFQPPKVA